jgi:hypothetical protein
MVAENQSQVASDVPSRPLEDGEVEDEPEGDDLTDKEEVEKGRYKRKLKAVWEMFQLPEPQSKKSTSLSVASTEKVKYMLPHKSDYMELFREYTCMDQVKGLKRVGKKGGVPLEQGAWLLANMANQG